MPVPITVRVLKDRRVRCHFFVHSEKGPIHTAPRIEIAPGISPMQIGGASGFIACQPQRQQINGAISGGRIEVTFVSDECRATTCPECIATEAFKKAAEELAAMLAEHA